MKAARLIQSESLTGALVGRRCRLCRKVCRIGQTVLYDTSHILFHRTCFQTFADEMYALLPLQEDEHPGHDLFAETKEHAALREFNEYRERLLKRQQ